jgi:hypothetical protein
MARPRPAPSLTVIAPPRLTPQTAPKAAHGPLLSTARGIEGGHSSPRRARLPSRKRGDAGSLVNITQTSPIYVLKLPLIILYSKD